MKHKMVMIILGMAVFLLLVMAASGGMLIPASDTGKEHSQAPANSPEIGDNFDLERIDFIHYAKPPGVVKPGKTTTCYKLLRLKWTNLPVTYVINPSTQEDLDPVFVTDAIVTAAETWDDASSRELFGSYSEDVTATYGNLDGKNVIAFGPYQDPNVIAVTSFWFSRSRGQIVEADILFNEYWAWGTADSPGDQMDIQNIATHEFGHVLGLDDLYTDSCKEVTMYGYSSLEEIKKQTLELPDIEGLQKIYG
jgi:predicted Zn-dependent protease